MPIIDHKEVRRKAEGNWINILSSLCQNIRPALSLIGKGHVACPIHGGFDGFRVFQDVNTTGGCVCNTCGIRPNGMETIMWSQGIGFYEAITQVNDYLGGCVNSNTTGGTTASCVSTSSVKDEKDEKSRMALRNAWIQSKKLYEGEYNSEVIRTYLKNRGLSIVPNILRVHPRMVYLEKGANIGNFITMLTPFSNIQGRIITLHRTYLTSEGKKASIAEPKKIMAYPRDNGVLSGSALRLFPMEGESIAIAEGIETAIAVKEATNLCCWAAGNAVLMKNFQIPEMVKRVHIFADRDKTGKTASLSLMQRLIEQGIEVHIHTPIIGDQSKAMDWLEVLVNYGRNYFPIIN